MSKDVDALPVRVLHVVGPMNVGGAEVMVMELLRQKNPSTQIDFLVHVRDLQEELPGVFDAEILARGSRLFHIVTPARIGVFAYLRDFQSLLARIGGADVVHIHLNARSGIVSLAAWLSRIPRIIVHSHAALVIRGSLKYRFVARLELFVSRVIFALVATDCWGCSREAVASLFPAWATPFRRRVCVINNAIDVERYLSISEQETQATRKALGLLPGDLLIGVVGRLVRHKNAAFLVRVLASIRARGVSAKLGFFGREQDPMYADEVRRASSDLKVDDAVIWAGERGDIPLVMAACDVFVSSALREGFGLVVVEAQAAGTPCVVSNGFPRSVDIGVGLVSFVDSLDPEAWADRVLESAGSRLPRDAFLREAFSRTGFDSRENTRQVERAYRDSRFVPEVRGRYD